jgi:predicted nucleotidyltransferase
VPGFFDVIIAVLTRLCQPLKWINTAIDSLIKKCSQEPKGQSVILFGSRAMERHQTHSDIDLAVKAPDLTYEEYLKLWRRLKDLPILNKIDLVVLNQTKDQDLLDHINQKGITLWSRESLSEA